MRPWRGAPRVFSADLGHRTLPPRMKETMTSSTDDNTACRSAASTGEPTRLRIRVEGMTCPSCERHVEQALVSAGAAEADADFRRGEAVITMPGTPDEAALRTAVESTGYRPGAIDTISPTPERTSDQRQYRMAIEGMTCSDCERHVAEALREAGASDPVANFRRGEARFSAPVTVEPRVFAEAVTQAGYRPARVESLAPERAEPRADGHGGSDRYDLAIVGSCGGDYCH